MEGGKTRIYKQNLPRLIRLTDFFGITDSSGLMPLSQIRDNGIINNGPKQTVAELEEQAKSGKPISLMELAQAARREQAQASQQEKKPSVLVKLCPPVNEPKKTARSKRAERELL